MIEIDKNFDFDDDKGSKIDESKNKSEKISKTVCPNNLKFGGALKIIKIKQNDDIYKKDE